jgi:hypothetical protein
MGAAELDSAIVIRGAAAGLVAGGRAAGVATRVGKEAASGVRGAKARAGGATVVTTGVVFGGGATVATAVVFGAGAGGAALRRRAVLAMTGAFGAETGRIGGDRSVFCAIKRGGADCGFSGSFGATARLCSGRMGAVGCGERANTGLSAREGR